MNGWGLIHHRNDNWSGQRELSHAMSRISRHIGSQVVIAEAMHRLSCTDAAARYEHVAHDGLVVSSDVIRAIILRRFVKVWFPQGTLSLVSGC